MNNNTEDILNNDESYNQQRLAALHNILNNEEGTSDEIDDDFEKDATEGLQQFDEHQIPHLVNELNRNLKLQLKSKKRVKKRIPDQSAVLITIITLLLLVILAFIIIKKYYQ